MSERNAPVVKIVMEKHENADALSIVRIGGFSVVVKTEDWKDIPFGVYIPPDEIVDSTRPEFSFLSTAGDKVRIKTKKLRGVYSQGLLVPAPENAKEGDNLYEALGLEHYEPEIDCVSSTNTDCVKAPSHQFSTLGKYDVENGRAAKYARCFTEGETVAVMEKLNGANFSAFFDGNEIYVKSRNFWKKDEPGSLFWQAFRSNPSFEKYIRENPGYLIRGEAYGKVGGFRYDTNGMPKLRLFDIMKPDMSYMNFDDFFKTCYDYEMNICPFYGKFQFNYDEFLKMAEGKTVLGEAHIREGIVVKPLVERYDSHLGRVIIKIVSNAYLEKN